jgi:hypothetical protein
MIYIVGTCKMSLKEKLILIKEKDYKAPPDTFQLI